MSEGSTARRITDALRELVLTGQLAPGTPLSQSKIAEDFGVSRIPVRDALRILAGEGLVDHSAPTVVVRPLSIGELQELYELREAVEPLVTRLALPNIGLAEIMQMTSLLQTMESGSRSTHEWLEANARFHGLIYTRAARPRAVELTEQLRRLTDRYLHLHLSVIGRTEHLHAEHNQILDAVRRCDSEAVGELTREHLITSHHFILDYLLENELMPVQQAADRNSVAR